MPENLFKRHFSCTYNNHQVRDELRAWFLLYKDHGRRYGLDALHLSFLGLVAKIVFQDIQVSSWSGVKYFIDSRMKRTIDEPFLLEAMNVFLSQLLNIEQNETISARLNLAWTVCSTLEAKLLYLWRCYSKKSHPNIVGSSAKNLTIYYDLSSTVVCKIQDRYEAAIISALEKLQEKVLKGPAWFHVTIFVIQQSIFKNSKDWEITLGFFDKMFLRIFLNHHIPNPLIERVVFHEMVHQCYCMVEESNIRALLVITEDMNKLMSTFYKEPGLSCLSYWKDVIDPTIECIHNRIEEMIVRLIEELVYDKTLLAQKIGMLPLRAKAVVDELIQRSEQVLALMELIQLSNPSHPMGSFMLSNPQEPPSHDSHERLDKCDSQNCYETDLPHGMSGAFFS